MQAHSQSSPAARSPFQVTRTTAPSVQAQPAVSSPPRLPRSVAKGPGLAHDAANLFAALGLYCDLLSAPEVLRPEHQHYIAGLRHLTTRSSNLIHKLLDALAPETAQPALGAPQAPPSGSNAAETLRHIEPLLSAIAGTSIHVVCKAPRSLLAPSLPAESLERILVNLVRNAAQAIESVAQLGNQPCDQGHIRITLATVAGHLRLCVEDDGPGMPVPVAAAFVSPSPLPPGARRGLGHRIVHELVTASGGRLSLRVRPGRGTTITAQWPLPHAAHAAPSTSATSSGASPATRRHGVGLC